MTQPALSGEDGRRVAEVKRRKTFAIISHPDAGKTTLTEKLLLYGGVIQLAGAVKAKRGRASAVSDWMEMERERGISISTSVMQFPYRGHEIISMPPPSSGGVALVQMLNVLEGYDVAASGPASPRTAHLMVEAMRRAFRVRARHLGDPDFARLPVARLTGKRYGDTLRATIDTLRATPSVLADVADMPESDQTTHYSVVDADGMGRAMRADRRNHLGVRDADDPRAGRGRRV